jgi:hypothetical protein
MSTSQRLYFYAEKLNESDHEPANEDRVIATRETANLVSSLCDDGLHRPALDLDIPCRLVPSSTEGHFHLYIEVGMTEAVYMELCDALAKAGLISSFYNKCAQLRKATFLRPEWVKKAVCTGVSASWCPVCGDCGCERDLDGEWGDPNPECPLHGDGSTHGDGITNAEQEVSI